jgi:hypothetical protein
MTVIIVQFFKFEDQSSPDTCCICTDDILHVLKDSAYIEDNTLIASLRIQLKNQNPLHRYIIWVEYPLRTTIFNNIEEKYDENFIKDMNEYLNYDDVFESACCEIFEGKCKTSIALAYLDELISYFKMR